MQNEVGALSRVAGMFSTRGYNIESLSVAPTDDPAVSRLTLVTTGSDAVIHQISSQLLKVKARATQVGKLWAAAQRAGGRVLWDAADSFTIELTSSEADISRFVTDAGAHGEVLEVVRSGALAIQKGKETLET